MLCLVPSTIGGSRRLSSVDAEHVEHLVAIVAGAEIAEGEGAFGRIGGAFAGQLEIEPVLAVERGRRLASISGMVRFMKTSCEPCWQAASPLPVCSKRSASSGRARISSTMAAARASSQSQPLADRLALAVDQPGAVALPGHRDRQPSGWRDRAPCRRARAGSWRHRLHVRAMSCSAPPPGSVS